MSTHIAGLLHSTVLLCHVAQDQTLFIPPCMSNLVSYTTVFKNLDYSQQWRPNQGRHLSHPPCLLYTFKEGCTSSLAGIAAHIGAAVLLQPFNSNWRSLGGLEVPQKGPEDLKFTDVALLWCRSQKMTCHLCMS